MGKNNSWLILNCTSPPACKKKAILSQQNTHWNFHRKGGKKQKEEEEFHSADKCLTTWKYILCQFKRDWLHSAPPRINCDGLSDHSANYVDKRCIFSLLLGAGGVRGGCGQCVSATVPRGRRQTDLLSPALRRQACGLCRVIIPRCPYTKPHAQQLALPEEFNNSCWKSDTRFKATASPSFPLRGPPALFPRAGHPRVRRFRCESANKYTLVRWITGSKCLKSG